jgi:hypothetical protein
VKLPRALEAEITEAKLADYLLNPAHPDNGGKAIFFARLGFVRENCEGLSAALRRLAKETEVAKVFESPYGTKYVLDGWLPGRNNKRAKVRSIWIVDMGRQIPRLVTAYPVTTS